MVRLLHLACRVWWLSSSAARLNFIPCVRASTCVPAPVSRPPSAHGYLLSYSDARWVTILLTTAKAVFFLSLTVKMRRQFRRARTPKTPFLDAAKPLLDLVGGFVPARELRPTMPTYTALGGWGVFRGDGAAGNGAPPASPWSGH
jgi:hypothetical protein